MDKKYTTEGLLETMAKWDKKYERSNGPRRSTSELIAYCRAYRRQFHQEISLIQAEKMLNEQAVAIEKYEAEAAERCRKAEIDAKVAETMKKWGF